MKTINTQHPFVLCRRSKRYGPWTAIKSYDSGCQAIAEREAVADGLATERELLHDYSTVKMEWMTFHLRHVATVARRKVMKGMIH